MCKHRAKYTQISGVSPYKTPHNHKLIALTHITLLNKKKNDMPIHITYQTDEICQQELNHQNASDQYIATPHTLFVPHSFHLHTD